VQGDQGIQGIQGVTGATGPQGPAGGNLAGHASFTYNTTTTAPPVANQLRINNAAWASATTIWVFDTDLDGLDVTTGLERMKAGYQVYVQDYDDSSKWVLYNVTASTVDSGTYHTMTVAYAAGAGTIGAGRVELQSIPPAQVGIPRGGTTDQVLSKVTSTDYAVNWTTLPTASATVSGLVELATTAEATAQTDTVRAVTPAGLADRVKTGYTITATTPLTIAGTTSADLSANRTIAVGAASDTATGVVELATAAEVLTGTDTTRAVTAAGVAGAYQPLSQAINAQTGTSYTLVLTDAGKIVTLSNAAAITLTVPTNASVAFPIGTSIDLIQLAAGQFTVTGAGPPTISKAMATAKSRTQYSVMTIIKTATDVWVATGDASAT
jgi:hypothetical protein